MEERLIKEITYEPPDVIEVAKESNSEKIRYNKVYNNCIWSSKHYYGFVYCIPVWGRELSVGIHPTGGVDYDDSRGQYSLDLVFGTDGQEKV